MMATNEKLEKPVKPGLIDFLLTEEIIKDLNNYLKQCERKASNYLVITFIIVFLLGSSFILINNFWKGYIILIIIFSAIITWAIIPAIFKAKTKKEIKDFIFHKNKSDIQAYVYMNHEKYKAALAEYKIKNDLFERALRRTAWIYWLSLNPVEFEEAVGDLFLDKGYKVFTTPVKGDQGVDLFLEKDNKSFVVQCKTYKKPLGPNAARDLYGTMVAHEAHGAYLAAPGGFSIATKEFCKGKPITLLDIDELTKMFYDFESYTPYWLDTAKSKEDVIRGINKHILGKPYRPRHY